MARLLLRLLVVAVPSAGAVGPIVPLTAEQAKILREHTAIYDKGYAAWMAGRRDEGLATLKKVVEIDARVVGLSHTATIKSLGYLVAAHRTRGEWREHIESLRRLAEAHAGLYGPDHWKTVDVRGRLKDAERDRTRTPAEREAAERAWEQSLKALGLYYAGKAAEGLPLAEKAAAALKAAHGEGHIRYAMGLGAVAKLRHGVGDTRQALAQLPLGDVGARGPWGP